MIEKTWTSTRQQGKIRPLIFHDEDRDDECIILDVSNLWRYDRVNGGIFLFEDATEAEMFADEIYDLVEAIKAK